VILVTDGNWWCPAEPILASIYVEDNPAIREKFNQIRVDE
jgi:hypothetical protein